MSELMIEEGIVIDDKEAVKEGIERISGKCLSDMGTVKKFVNCEKSTKFYMDSRGNCKMQPDRNTVYLWLDSGFTDDCGNPVMISLLNEGGTYSGHYSGTMRDLARSIREYYPGNKKDISRNMSSLKNKYNVKIAGRIHRHIEDENEYLLQVCNGTDDSCTMKSLLQDILAECCDGGETEEEKKEEPETPVPDEMNPDEREITFGLLFEKIEGMQNYIDELLAEIEKFNLEDRVKMAELEARNREYKRVIVQMRTFIDEENAKPEAGEQTGGHSLLKRNEKVLVLGACALDRNIMNGIVKSLGFEKNDFEYATDYCKISSYAGRIQRGEKYAAILFGACPHKVAGLGSWSSIIEKCRQCEEMPLALDARSQSGELKVTKDSFRRTLLKLCEELRKENENV